VLIGLIIYFVIRQRRGRRAPVEAAADEVSERIPD